MSSAQSSHPGDTLKVTEVQTNNSGSTVYFTDGAVLFVPANLASSYSFIDGQMISEAERDAARMSIERYVIRNKSIELLARREHSVLELRRKLQKRYPDATRIPEVLDELQTDGLLDNRRFAEAFVRSRLKRAGTSTAKLIAELGARGVDRRDVELSIKEVFKDEEYNEFALLARAIQKLWPNSVEKSDIMKLRHKLLRRGFKGLDIEKEIGRQLEKLGAEFRQDD